ncbi:membrane protein [Salsuginibacillus halophilus]|uniref:Membrane protein n=1 Tax=Salsuginibacillus halophilus TaxID=517424 RepID=A0A2P8HBG7_9BACI|nr:YihY/virulence factor BrkB family protein [Salsuginibacillus halophilus]PSL43549.1 membrane protein [Salsuginibacillus halophilus]
MKYLRQLINECQEDNVPLLAAAQGFYYMLSVVPLVILILGVLPYLEIKPEQAMNFAASVLPGEALAVFQETILDVISVPSGGVLTFGAIGTIWSASLGVNAFIRATNEAYNTTDKRSFLGARFMSMGLTLLLIFVVIVTLLLPVFGNALLEMSRGWVAVPEDMNFVFQLARWGLSVIVMLIVLVGLYRLAPKKKLGFKDVWPGAILAALGWQLISWGFSVYISYFDMFSATYGSLGGLMILMLWFFMTGLILIVGAEVNALYHRYKYGEMS